MEVAGKLWFIAHVLFVGQWYLDQMLNCLKCHAGSLPIIYDSEWFWKCSVIIATNKSDAHFILV